MRVEDNKRQVALGIGRIGSLTKICSPLDTPLGMEF